MCRGPGFLVLEYIWDSALGSACLDNLIRCFNSKSTLFLDWDPCFPIGTDFSKCINICVSYQGL